MLKKRFAYFGLLMMLVAAFASFSAPTSVFAAESCSFGSPNSVIDDLAMDDTTLVRGQQAWVFNFWHTNCDDFSTGYVRRRVMIDLPPGFNINWAYRYDQNGNFTTQGCSISANHAWCIYDEVNGPITQNNPAEMTVRFVVPANATLGNYSSVGLLGNWNPYTTVYASKTKPFTVS